MASLGLEGVNKVSLVSSDQPWPFDIPHTLGNTTKEFNSSLAIRIFLWTFESSFLAKIFSFIMHLTQHFMYLCLWDY